MSAVALRLQSTLGASFSAEKASKGEVHPTRGGVLEPTWARLGAENGPKMHFYRSGVVLGRFWKDFGPIRGDFSTILVDF